ncbi:DUF2997 domain-containing protein [Microbacterium stercoris]|uniref:DUF2997 domain-containing protein n=1 Tax=Microbacterium stercoris TaxID=2820289 RepID=A0A939QG46_9MICO|nr:DUF2997 domain-containing protein [Microbacterium stercoris]MBO3662118.1 DUF2997 domain-containing protein [Microbacterium stercoris]
MTKQIIVRVRKDGTIDAETVGMHGAECLDYFATLEDLLDAETSSSAYTADYDAVSAEEQWADVDHDHSHAEGS